MLSCVAIIPKVIFKKQQRMKTLVDQKRTIIAQAVDCCWKYWFGG